MVFTFVVSYLPQFIIHRTHGGIKDSFYDVLWLQDKNGKFFNFMISSDKQYNHIKRYLLVKTGIRRIKNYFCLYLGLVVRLK